MANEKAKKMISAKNPEIDKHEDTSDTKINNLEPTTKENRPTILKEKVYEQ